MHWGEENCIQGLVRKHEGKRLLRRPRSRWEISIAVGLNNRIRGRGLDSFDSG
jgi:hypothetical protein